MSLKQFFVQQRKKQIRLIYSSIADKCSRFRNIYNFSDEITKKNNLRPDDDTVESQLRQLKKLIDFNNQDTTNQIDLVLEQHDLINQTEITIQSSQSQFEEECEFEQEDEEQKGSDDSSEKESKKITKKILHPNPPKNTGEIASIPHKKSIQKQDQSASSFKPQSDWLEAFNLKGKIQGRHTQARNEYAIQRAEVTVNDEELSKFKYYLEQINEFESKFYISVTPKFKDMNFFFLRTQNSSLPVRYMLDDNDKKMIAKVSRVLDAQCEVVRLLHIKSRLVSLLIQENAEQAENKKYSQPLNIKKIKPSNPSQSILQTKKEIIKQK